MRIIIEDCDCIYDDPATIGKSLEKLIGKTAYPLPLGAFVIALQTPETRVVRVKKAKKDWDQNLEETA